MFICESCGKKFSRPFFIEMPNKREFEICPYCRSDSFYDTERDKDSYDEYEDGSVEE